MCHSKNNGPVEVKVKVIVSNVLVLKIHLVQLDVTWKYGVAVICPSCSSRCVPTSIRLAGACYHFVKLNRGKIDSSRIDVSEIENSIGKEIRSDFGDSGSHEQIIMLPTIIPRIHFI